MQFFGRGLAAVLFFTAAVLLAGDEPSKEDLEFFEKKVRPLLADNCFECHGPDKQKANLRLDSREAIIKGGDSGPAIDPGNPDGSLMIEAVNYQGDTQMPPKGKLDDEKIADLRDWIKRGAPWSREKPKEKSSPVKEAFDLKARRAKQWAFQPIQKVDPPAVKDASWPKTTIDRFLLARLEAAGLRPAAPADKRTLLRRVTYDLIGLPPTPQETAEFLADGSPQAFEKVVDRLLSSPHYGERWARHWLDLVRFAETRGHEFDFEIPHAFEYRDYVIRAFNADVPYHQFAIEHLAGDLLEKPRRDPQTGINESIVGTGFWFLGEAKHSPVDILGDEADRVDNQIDVFGKTFLACTLGCARCHDHKFDAISQKDYYALAGYLQSSRYQVASIDSPELRVGLCNQLEDLWKEKETSLRSELGTAVQDEPLADALQAALVAMARKPEELPGIAAQFKLDVPRLERWLAQMKAARDDSAHPLHWWARLGSLTSDPQQITAAQLAGLRDAALAEVQRCREPQEGVTLFADLGVTFEGWTPTGEAFGAGPFQSPWQTSTPPLTPRGDVLAAGANSGRLAPQLQGALRSRTFEITHPRIWYRMSGSNCRVRLVLDNLQLIQNPIYGGLEFKLNEAGPVKWHGQNVDKWIGHKAYIEVLDEGEGQIAVEQIAFTQDAPPRVKPFNSIVPRAFSESPKTAAELAQAYAASIRHAVKDEFAPAFLIPILAARLTKTAEIEAKMKELGGKIRYERKAVAMTDGTSRDEHLFLRGNPRKHGDIVPRRFLEALSGEHQRSPDEGSGRLGLAGRVVDPANPLTARVIVNRIWKQHFGTGLVATPDDFGNMGQPPSHPELLDFLAAEFMDDGWSLKRLHKRILLSAAWQMASVSADTGANERDPQNRMWHRMAVRRLEAECIRDAILAVSGRLDHRTQGPSVLPHLTPFMIGRGRPGQTGPLDGDGRRSIYISVRRNFLTPFFLAFDAPIPFATVGRRSVSNVPAQALALMNNPFVVQQAEVWAKKAATASPDPDARIQSMYETAFTRLPTAEELASAREFLAAQAAQHAPAEAAEKPWADFAHVLLNVKEFIFVN